MWDRVTIKENAKEQLRAWRGSSIGVLVLYGVLTAVLTYSTLGIASLFLMPPLLVGLSLFYLYVWRGEGPSFETLFAGFRRYTQSLVGILWMYLWIFLWSLLFIIPGIVKAYAYSMTPYLLADNPNLAPTEALRLSMAITDGHKAEIFVMHLSFLGWMILSGFTFGILYIVHVGPYMQISMAGLYESLRLQALETGAVSEADFVA